MQPPAFTDLPVFETDLPSEIVQVKLITGLTKYVAIRARTTFATDQRNNAGPKVHLRSQRRRQRLKLAMRRQTLLAPLSVRRLSLERHSYLWFLVGAKDLEGPPVMSSSRATRDM